MIMESEYCAVWKVPSGHSLPKMSCGDELYNLLKGMLASQSSGISYT